MYYLICKLCSGVFQVIVRNVPHESGRSISDNVEGFFKKNHPDHYLCHQVFSLVLFVSCSKYSSFMKAFLICLYCYLWPTDANALFVLLDYRLPRLSIMQTSLPNLSAKEIGFKIGWIITSLSLKEIRTRGQPVRYALLGIQIERSRFCWHNHARKEHNHICCQYLLFWYYTLPPLFRQASLDFGAKKLILLSTINTRLKSSTEW